MMMVKKKLIQFKKNCIAADWLGEYKAMDFCLDQTAEVALKSNLFLDPTQLMRCMDPGKTCLAKRAPLVPI